MRVSERECASERERACAKKRACVCARERMCVSHIAQDTRSFSCARVLSLARSHSLSHSLSPFLSRAQDRERVCHALHSQQGGLERAWRLVISHEWVMAHIDESRHTWMSHGTHISEVCLTFAVLMKKSHGRHTHMNEHESSRARARDKLWAWVSHRVKARVRAREMECECECLSRARTSVSVSVILTLCLSLCVTLSEGER